MSISMEGWGSTGTGRELGYIENWGAGAGWTAEPEAARSGSESDEAALGERRGGSSESEVPSGSGSGEVAQLPAVRSMTW